MTGNKPDTPQIINLSRYLDHRGNLSVVEQRKDIPFDIRRAYWVYDVPGGEEREGHAYFSNEEFIIALSGSFDIITDDGFNRRVYPLNRSYYGLYVPAGTWRTLTNFSTNSVALILASTSYNPDDYIYAYEDFQRIKHNF